MIKRQTNWLGQQRCDVVHLRAAESSVAADFDDLAGRIVAGARPRVVSGFKPLSTGAVGAPATSLKISVAGSKVLHPLASEPGSMHVVPADRALEQLTGTNPRVEGSWTAGATNYVGIDLRRAADDSTADVVQFLDPEEEDEFPEEVPLARTMDYVLTISTTGFDASPSVCPVAIVVVDGSGVVTSLEDARQLLLRLGTGGTVPDPLASWQWPEGRHEETAVDGFSGGDKVFSSLKDWLDAAMTRMWELGGGEHWYSPTADRNVRMIKTSTPFSNSEWFEWDGTNLHWKNLRMVFDNSTGTFNDVANQTSDSAGLTDLADGECIYVDIDRTQNLTGGSALLAVKSPLSTLGTPVVPGSRYVLAWRSGTSVFGRDSAFPVGTTFTVATNTNLGIVQLTYAAGTPSVPKVAPQDADGRIHNTATANNKAGFEGTSHGSGPGVKGNGGSSNGDGVWGVANGTGIGVRATGSSGPAMKAFSTSGEGVIIKHDFDTAKASILVQDSAGNNRTVFDRGGYRMGRTTSWDVNWGTGGIGIDGTFAGTNEPAEGWTVGASDTDMSVTLVAPTSTYPAIMISLNAVAATDANDYAVCSTSQKIIHTGFTGMLFAAEWEAAVSLVTTSDRDVNLVMGLGDDLTGILGGTDPLTGTPNFIGFGIPDGDTSGGWSCYTKTGSGGSITKTAPAGQVGSGVVFSAGEILKFRIEIWGSGLPYGSTRVLFFIDSAASTACTFRAAHTTNIPSAALYAYFLNQVVTGGATVDLAVGPLRMEWNRFLTAPTQ